MMGGDGEDLRVSFRELYEKKMNRDSLLHGIYVYNQEIGIVTNYKMDNEHTKFGITILKTKQNKLVEDESELTKYEGNLSSTGTKLIKKIITSYYNRVLTESAENMMVVYEELSKKKGRKLMLKHVMHACVYLIRRTEFLKDPRKVMNFVRKHSDNDGIYASLYGRLSKRVERTALV